MAGVERLPVLALGSCRAHRVSTDLAALSNRFMRSLTPKTLKKLGLTRGYVMNILRQYDRAERDPVAGIVEQGEFNQTAS